MDATQTLEQWFESADNAMPVLTESARFVIVALGLLMWLAGGKLLRAACAMGGMALGMILGGLTMAFLDSAWVAMGFIIGLGLVGGFGAILIYRTWVAFALAIMFAALAPVGVLVWEGASAQQELSDDAQEAAEQVQTRYDHLASGLSDDTRLEVQSLIEQGDPEALTDANELLADKGEAVAEKVERAAFQNLEDIQTWWNSSSTAMHRTLGFAMLIGAGVGFLIGFVAPSYAAAAQSALVGAFMIVLPGRELVASRLPDAAGLVPVSPRGTLITLGLITVVGLALQWTLHLRRDDKRT